MYSSTIGRTLRAVACFVHFAIGAMIAVMLIATGANASAHLCRSLACARDSGDPPPGIIPIITFSGVNFAFDDGTAGITGLYLEDFLTFDGSIRGFFYSQDGSGLGDRADGATWCEPYGCDLFNSSGAFISHLDTYIFIRPKFDGMIFFSLSTDYETNYIQGKAEISDILTPRGFGSDVSSVSFLYVTEKSVGGFECTGPVNEAPNGFTSPFYCASDQYRTIVNGSYLAVFGGSYVPEPSAVVLLISGFLVMTFVFKLRRNGRIKGASSDLDFDCANLPSWRPGTVAHGPVRAAASGAEARTLTVPLRAQWIKTGSILGALSRHLSIG